MREYIEKEKLFDCLDIKNALGGHYGISLTAINAIPAADVVEVRHGQWERVDYGNGLYNYHCSSCRHIPRENIRSNYCPNCGSKMNGGEEE